MSQPKLGGDVVAVLVLSAVLTLIGLVAENSWLGLLLGIVVLGLLTYAMSRVPLRLSMMALTFFVFVLPNPGEGKPTEWDPPLTKIGAILLNHLNTVDRTFSLLSSVPISGIDIMFVLLGLIYYARKSSRSKIDTFGQLATPKPMLQLARLSMASTVFTWLSGMARGGEFSFSLWQFNTVIYLPIVFLLFHVSLRGPADNESLAKVILAAATYKCFMAYYVVHAFKMPMDPETGSTSPPYGTSHNDSMLFATAFVLIIAPLIDGAGKRAIKIAAIFLPILIMGTIANNRRLAWVQVGLVFVTVYFISRETPMKRKLRRTFYASLPVLGIYAMLGWSSQFGKFYKPVRMIRSIVDAKSDGSSQWRELENVNIIATFRDGTLFGTGFGHPYKEVVVLPRVDYALERYTPHNSLLGVWAYEGVVGYAGLTLLWMGGVYFAMRAYYNGQLQGQRTAALISFGTVLVYLLQSWGDLGLGSWTGVFLMGGALATAGKVATATGQWGDSKPKGPAQPTAQPMA